MRQSQAKIETKDLMVVPSFAALAKTSVEKIVAVAKSHEATSGKFLVRNHTPGNEILFLLEGKAKVCQADQGGKEVILGLLGPGAMIGEIAFLISGLRTADVIALTKCRLALFTRDDFLALLKSDANLGVELLKSMAARLKNASQRISDMALHDVNMRVSRILVGMSVPSIIDGEEALVIPERPTHQTLASMVGASRETVTRALHELEGAGHISIDGERVIVYSMPG